jgi:hypothetical protein
VAQAKNGTVNIQFRRWLYRELAESWDKICEDMDNFSLVNEPDIIYWKLEKSGKFSVKSMYNSLTSNDSGLYQKRIWKGKIPPKNQNIHVVNVQ